MKIILLTIILLNTLGLIQGNCVPKNIQFGFTNDNSTLFEYINIESHKASEWYLSFNNGECVVLNIEAYHETSMTNSVGYLSNIQHENGRNVYKFKNIKKESTILEYVFRVNYSNGRYYDIVLKDFYSTNQNDDLILDFYDQKVLLNYNQQAKELKANKQYQLQDFLVTIKDVSSIFSDSQYSDLILEKLKEKLISSQNANKIKVLYLINDFCLQDLTKLTKIQKAQCKDLSTFLKESGADLIIDHKNEKFELCSKLSSNLLCDNLEDEFMLNARIFKQDSCPILIHDKQLNESCNYSAEEYDVMESIIYDKNENIQFQFSVKQIDDDKKKISDLLLVKTKHKNNIIRYDQIIAANNTSNNTDPNADRKKNAKFYSTVLLVVFVCAFAFFIGNTIRCYAKKRRDQLTREERYEMEKYNDKSDLHDIENI